MKVSKIPDLVADFHGFQGLSSFRVCFCEAHFEWGVCVRYEWGGEGGGDRMNVRQHHTHTHIWSDNNPCKCLEVLINL